MFVHSGFKGQKIVKLEKEGGRESVPVPRSHRNKYKANGLVRHFSNSMLLLGIGKLRVKVKKSSDGIIDFILSR